MELIPHRSSVKPSLCRSFAAGALVWGILLLGSRGEVRAQTTTQRLLMHSKRHISFSGSAGFTGEAYATTATSRRPPLSGRSFVRATVNAFGIRTGFNLLYSTEQNQVRQSLNRIGFESTWRWVKVGIGDTYPSFSEFSINGLQLRGGVIEMSPGPVRVGFAAGRTKRATQNRNDDTVLDSPRLNNTFRRDITAIRIGIGDVSGNHFHLIGMKARDDTLSIRVPGFARPEENLSLTSLAGARLFEGILNFAIEGTLSAHNHDLFARKIDTDDLLDPDSTDLPTIVLPVARLFTRLFTPTISTSLGYAVKAQASLRLKNMNLRTQYKRIGPGFTSLGVFTVRNDVEEWQLRPNFRFKQGRFSVALNYGQSNNNLSNERATSRRRNQIGVNVRAQLSPMFSVGTSFQQGTSEIKPEIDNPALLREQVSQNATLNPTLIIKRGSRTHTFNLSTSIQRFFDRRSSAESDTLAQATADFRNVNASLSWFGSVSDRWNLHTTVNMLQNKTTSNTSVWGVNAGASGNFYERKLSLGLTLGATQTTRSSGSAMMNTDLTLLQLTSNLNAGYRITKSDQIRLSVRALHSQNSDSGTGSFNEIRTQIHFSRGF